MPGIAHATVVLVSAGHAQLILLPKRHQTVVDLDPRTVVLGISLALAVLLAAARAVDKALGALGHGADAAGRAEYAVAAHAAVFVEHANSLHLTQEHGVVRGIDGKEQIVRYGLGSVTTRHANHRLRT